MNFLKTIRSLLRDYFVEILFLGLPALIAFGAWLFTDETIKFLSDVELTRVRYKYTALFLIVAGSLLYLYLIPVYLKRQKRISHLEILVNTLNTDLETISQDLISMSEGYVLGLGIKLGFGEKSEVIDRITVYTHENNRFYSFGRFSFHPEYKKAKNDLYPNNKGCIAKAWGNGVHFDNQYSDWKTDQNSYLTKLRSEGYKNSEIRLMRMKSRLYFGWGIRNIEDTERLAVIIVESTDPNRWTEDYLRDFFNKEKRTLREVINRLAPRIPKMAEARKEGF